MLKSWLLGGIYGKSNRALMFSAVLFHLSYWGAQKLCYVQNGRVYPE